MGAERDSATTRPSGSVTVSSPSRATRTMAKPLSTPRSVDRRAAYNATSPAEEERIKALEREVRELRKATEILHLASAFFAQAELDRRFKP
jgi:transposase-like protein